MVKVFSRINSSCTDFFRNISFALPPMLLLIFFTSLSYISKEVNYGLSNTLALTTWLISFLIIYLLVLSFTFSGLVSMSSSIAKRKSYSFSDFIKAGKKYTIKSFAIIAISLILYNLISFITTVISLSIGRSLDLPLAQAQIIFVAIYAALLLSTAIFIIFSGFYLIIKDFSIIKSLKASMTLVKNNYFQTLLTIIIFLVPIIILETYLDYKIFNILTLSEIINTLLIYPIFILVLTKFVLSSEK